jgi:hypothetical protein
MEDDTPKTVIFLTRRGCSLCDEALPIVEREAHARGHSIDAVDVTGTAWEERYGDRVPVLVVDGAVVLAGRFGEADIRKVLA